MNVVTIEYVETRFATFLIKYKSVLTGLGYGENEIAERVSSLKARLDQRDFKLYGDRPINILHGGKRITRNLIAGAIKYSPAQMVKVSRLRDDYAAKCAEIRKNQPHATFFSFEAAYANKLRVDLKPHRNLFYI
jgi:hypothetical protein